MTDVARIGLSLWISCWLCAGCSHMNDHVDISDPSLAAQARLRLGLAYLSAGELPQAQQNLAVAADYAPDDYQILQGMALYQQYLGDYQTAAYYYEQAIKRQPDDASLHNNYATLLCQSGEYQRAQQQFNLAISSHDYRFIADSLENSGYCFLRGGELVNAVQPLSQALMKSPDKGTHLLLTAEHYLHQQDYPQAKLLLMIYEKVLPLNANSVWLQLRIAMAEQQPEQISYYRQQLAENFPQSEQYQQFVANEY